MPTIDLSADKPVVGTASDANLIRNAFDAIQAAVNALDNNNIAAGAGILPSKLGQAGATQGQGLLWDSVSSSWKPGTIAATTYRKTTSKAVNTTVAATDLLNGEITVAAGAMGATGALRIRAWGDWLQNSGGNSGQPRFQLVFGGTTLIDTGVTATAAAFDAFRRNWMIEALILNSATNAQDITSRIDLVLNASSGVTNSFTTGNGEWGTVNLIGGTAERQALALGSNTSAVDTTAAKALVLNVINGSASASYETKLRGALVEVI